MALETFKLTQLPAAVQQINEPALLPQIQEGNGNQDPLRSLSEFL